MGEFAEVEPSNARDALGIGFSSTAVPSPCYKDLDIQLHLIIKTTACQYCTSYSNRLRHFLHAASSFLGMWTVKTFYRHNAMHLATRLLHTYLCTCLILPSPMPFTTDGVSNDI